MKSRGRRRQWVEEPEEPFAAGLFDREEILLALYGLQATLYPVDQVTDEDEAAELLPWPEGAAEPVFIDRFDVRLILDPLELAPPRRSAASAVHESQELEEELEFERWRELWALQRRQRRGSASPSAAASDDERVDNDGRDAVGYGYEKADARLQGLEPPPPPPVGLLDVSGAALLEPGALMAALQGRLPFTGTQLAVMQRTAEFLRRCGEPGAALLQEAAADDPTFAFLSPDHLWHEFFQGILDNKASMLDDRPADAAIAVSAVPESSGSGSGSGGKDDGGLGSLLGEYMSDEDDGGEQEDKEIDAMTKALIKRLVAAAASGGPELATRTRERLAGDPDMVFLDPNSTQNAAFRAALEDAGLPEETISAWCGAHAAPHTEPAPPVNETLHAGVVVQAAPITFAAAPSGGQGAAGGAGAAVAAPPQWLIEKMRAAAGVPGPPKAAVVDAEREKEAPPGPEAEGAAAAAAAAATEAKKAERRRKVREVLERQRKLEEERRQGQAAARRQAEEERQRHLAAISQHKKMFLDDD